MKFFVEVDRWKGFYNFGLTWTIQRRLEQALGFKESTPLGIWLGLHLGLIYVRIGFDLKPKSGNRPL